MLTFVLGISGAGGHRRGHAHGVLANSKARSGSCYVVMQKWPLLSREAAEAEEKSTVHRTTENIPI